MALYIPHSIFHLALLLYVRPENFGPYYVSTQSLFIIDIYFFIYIYISCVADILYFGRQRSNSTTIDT
jgi:hypothetical protein